MDMNARAEQNNASFVICLIFSSSVSGPSDRINLRSVTGALLSFDAINLKSSVRVVGRAFTSLCSTIFFILERKRNEFMTAGNSAITAMISDLPAMAIAPSIVPINNVPESPGNIPLRVPVVLVKS